LFAVVDIPSNRIVSRYSGCGSGLGGDQAGVVANDPSNAAMNQMAAHLARLRA
jgi:hypothetical protein